MGAVVGPKNSTDQGINNTALEMVNQNPATHNHRAVLQCCLFPVPSTNFFSYILTLNILMASNESKLKIQQLLLNENSQHVLCGSREVRLSDDVFKNDQRTLKAAWRTELLVFTL